MPSIRPTRLLSRLPFVVGAVAVAATLAWAGYTVGRVQDIAELASFTRNIDTDRYTFQRGNLIVHFERLGGDGKPYIRAADGTELLDYSDWDTGARIFVDGTGYELVRLYPTSAVDYYAFRVAETLHGDGWELIREVTAAADGSLFVQHSFVARREISHVELAVVRSHSNQAALTVESGSAVLQFSGVSAGASQPGRSAFIVRLSTDPSGGDTVLHSGPGKGAGFESVVSTTSADNPPPDRRTPLGFERIRVDPPL